MPGVVEVGSQGGREETRKREKERQRERGAGDRMRECRFY